MNSPLVTCSVVLLASALTAQQAITTVFGPTVNGQTGYLVAGAGDLDSDNVPDFLVSSPYSGNGLLQIVSGATRTTRNITNTIAGGGWGTNVLIGTGDMNLDGVRDLVINRGQQLVALSGANGALLWQTAGIGFDAATSVGDLDLDGRSDLAVVVNISNNSYLWTLRGSNGTQLQAYAPSLNGITTSLVNLGDIDNDGKPEVARASGTTPEIFHTSPPSFVRSIQPWCSRVAAGNVAGDARNEVLGADYTYVYAFSATTGALLRTYDRVHNSMFAVLGDLDADGFDDLGLRAVPNNPGYGVDILSGRTGTRLGQWLGSPRLGCVNLAGVGDVNGDGHGDLLIGDQDARANPSLGPTTGGWQLVSGKLLASMTSIPVQCAQGPWFPQLGITRPLIGQTCTIEGRDCPLGTMGVLALSLQPPLPTSFGVVGCDAWWDVSNWVMLHHPSGVTWTFPVPIPNAPQLAGLGVALQAFYLPTSSPIGFDLSNAVWARLGF